MGWAAGPSTCVPLTPAGAPSWTITGTLFNLSYHKHQNLNDSSRLCLFCRVASDEWRTDAEWGSSCTP